jgi:tetratricopeptide (TPR) repeat protein
MAKVSLRIYNREIGTLIDQGQIEEAVGHCHHILKTYPKHLETYRLLGKAYLEAKRYKDAADIFSRLLMSVPDDFVAHVGMSLISDETEKFDEAIWHMERAFESQPSNAAVQSELQRLYGRRDGVQPPKIRMTSGALANVYVQGELYTQAIAEIMSVETQDPGRMDMQILLSKAYFYSGQRVEASKIASDLLAKYPYCLDANRILVEVLPETNRAESTQVYRHRVNALDPYATFVKGSIFNIDEVPDAAISLERLDWHPGDTPQLDSNWDSSSGIQFEQEEEEQPAWLKEGTDTPEPEPASAMDSPAEEENIPDFMREAGWGASSGAADESDSIFDVSNSDDEPIEQGEMPDWMKDIAPKPEELATEQENEMGDEMANEWIDDLLGDSEEEKPEEKKAESTDDIGDLGTSSEEQDAALNWLESLAANQGANPEELITDPNARTEEAPEWVQKAQDQDVSVEPSEPVEPAPVMDKAGAGDVPKWLQDDEEPEAVPEMEASPPSDEPQTPVESAPVSDPMIGDLGTSSEEQDAALNWLENLAANQGANPEELITDPNARTEDAPEWVQKAQDASVETSTEEETLPAPVASEEDDDMEWLNEMSTQDSPAPAESSPEDAPEFLQEEKTDEPTPVAPPESEAEDDMAWLNALGDDAALLSTDEKEEDALLSESAKVKLDQRILTPEPSAPPPVAEDSDTPVAIEEPAEELPEMPVEQPIETEEGDTTPTWIRRMDSGETPAPPPVESEPVQGDDDLPTWLSNLGGETNEAPPQEEDLPDWLKSDEEAAPVADEVKPVQADEWKPVEPATGSEDRVVKESVIPPLPLAEPQEAPVQEETKAPEVESEAIQPEPVTEKTATEKPAHKSKRMDTTMLRDVTLMSGQAAMQEGNVTAALAEYEKLIKKNRLLEETIADLREALYEYPVDVTIWQTLGDAYMRVGRLQDALDAYTKAEELLR